MKKTKKTNRVFVIGILATLAVAMSLGCASTPSTTAGTAQTIEEAHPDRIEKTIVGMDINEFKTVWPEAIRTGVSTDGETYEFVYTNVALGGIAYNFRIYITFYFTNNKLVRYESIRRI